MVLSCIFFLLPSLLAGSLILVLREGTQLVLVYRGLQMPGWCPCWAGLCLPSETLLLCIIGPEKQNQQSPYCEEVPAAWRAEEASRG